MRVNDEPERYVRSGTARLWTTSSGCGTPLLLFNGGPGCDDYLAPVAEMIDDLCQVIRFEPRGCGRSDWDGNYDVETLVSDAEAIRQDYGAERLIVAGHSAGPDFALAYALLSQVHSGMWWYFVDRTQERLAMAKEAVDKALTLDPDLPEGHEALGLYHYWGYLEYERALAAGG